MIDYTHLRHQRHRKLLLLTIINMQSIFLPAMLPNIHRFQKFFFTGTLGNIFVKMSVENFTTPQMCGYTTL